MHVLMYNSQMVEEFEQGWGSMIETFELHDNEWLSGLFKAEVVSSLLFKNKFLDWDVNNIAE